MASLRGTIPDFQLANPIYTAATVTFYAVDDDGDATTTLATLYAGPTGSETLSNPQTLDGDGKFAAPVYIDTPVIAEVVGANVASHSTGIIYARGLWKGTWITGTRYFSEDMLQDPATSDIVIAADDFTSGASVAADIAAGHLSIVIDASAVFALTINDLYQGTSTTALAIGTGSKTLTTQAGKGWSVGDFLIAYSAADPAKYMAGQVTSYSSTSLAVTVTKTSGSGSVNDWTIRLSGAPGTQGDEGEKGDTGTTGPSGPIKVLSRVLTSPPVSPTINDAYVIPTAGVSGDWSGHEDEIATWSGSAWTYAAPARGELVVIADATDNLADRLFEWNGSAWETMGDPYKNAPPVDVAVASTANIGLAASWQVTLTTGTGPITSFGSSTYRSRLVRCNVDVKVAYNATTLITPTRRDIQFLAGDMFWAISDGSGNWRVVLIQRADGHAVDRRLCVQIGGSLEPAAMTGAFSAFLMQDGTVMTTGANLDALGHGANLQTVYFPTRIILPSGLLGTPTDLLVSYRNLWIRTDLGDVCAIGLNGEGEIGDGTTTTRNIATLISATNITPRSAGGANRAVTKIATTASSGGNSTQSVYFVCADGSLWACGHNAYRQLADGTATNRSSPVRCMKAASSYAKAAAESPATNSNSTLTPAVGSKTFTVAAGGPWVMNDPVYFYSPASYAAASGFYSNWGVGTVTSYSGTTLIIDVTAVGTPASASDWVISTLVDDAADIYASGGNYGCVGYIDTSGKARLAGYLNSGAPGLNLSASYSAQQGVFKKPLTATDAGELPDAYVATKLVMACTNAPLDTVGILCEDKKFYVIGFGTNGQTGQGATSDVNVAKQAGKGTAAETALGTIVDVWNLDNYVAAFAATVESGALYVWGYGASYCLPGIAGTNANATPATAGAPLNGAPNVTAISTGGNYDAGHYSTCIAVTAAGAVYSWGSLAGGNGATPSQTATARLVADPHAGTVDIIDVACNGTNGTVCSHILYANGEVWSFNNSGASSGQLGLGSANAPYMPCRTVFS